MKKVIKKSIHLLIIALAHLLINSSIFAQAPQKMSYQAVIRNSNDSLLVSTPVGMRISLVQSSPTGTVVFSETQTATTNDNGLVSLQIGMGTAVSGTFTGIDWAAGPYYVKTETDLSGGTNYTIISSNELLSVPYALFSANGTPGPSAYQVAVENGFSGTETQWLESLQGVNGINGTNGTNGETGATGPAGTFPPGTVAGEMNYWNGTAWVTVAPGISLPGNQVQTLGFCNGVPTWGPCPAVLPTVTTTAVSDITAFSASSGGTVTNDGGDAGTAWGVCWSTSANPTLANSFFQNNDYSVSFSSALSGLTPNTTFYVRAYATNIVGTVYGNEVSFTTLPLTLPILITAAIENISNTTAVSGGSISSDGGAPITTRGVCWSTSQNPTLTNNITNDGVGVGTYLSNMSALNPNTTYYVRAYASNSVGTAYGNEIVFTSNTVTLPVLTTNPITIVSYTGATGGGNVTNDGGNPVTARGICWSTSFNPTIANSVTSSASGLGIFIASMTELTPNTTYYVRAYATNLGGTVYGNQVIFSTLVSTLPSVITTVISGISTTSASGGGNVTDDGGSTVTARGICWSTSSTPTLLSFTTIDASGTGNYYSILTNLSLSTTYYVRAYASNSIGVAYGSEVSFTTASTIPAFSVPVLGTMAVTLNSATIASGGGYISFDGGSVVTARGVCYSTSQNPTTADNISNDGMGPGFFLSTVSNLSGCNVTYYARAYATNSSGTGYGNQVSFTTGLAPFGVSTSFVDNITSNSAICGGAITSDEGCPIIARGICWSYTTSTPTIADEIVSVIGGVGTFTSNLSGLLPGISYYVRSYATNSKGTSYGNVQVFNTADTTGFYLGQEYGGGIIFYIDNSGQHGLIAGTADQGNAFWGCPGTSIPETQSTVGSGATNTAAIIAGCSEPNIAARICDELQLNGYNDWFLPNINELALMYQYRGLIGGFASVYTDVYSPHYWSSLETDALNAWSFNFEDGTSHSNWWGYTYSNKLYNFKIRAVRAF
jgi:hypothetical protein